MKTLALGEILWDLIEGKAHIGGAPFNLTAHLAKLGAETYLVSSVGTDKLGREALDIAEKLNVKTDFLSVLPDRPTGTVDVTLSNGQPDYTINENVAWDAISIPTVQWKKLFDLELDFVIFGTLAQRSEANRILYRKIFEGIHSKEVFFDINFRKNYFSKEICATSMRYASILKLNDEEVVVLSRMIYGKALSFEAFSKKVSSDFNIHTICITRGGDGVLVFSKGKFYDIAGVKVEVADTVGAGDSFSAAFLYTYYQTGDAREAAEKGCRMGAFVASQPGAIPEYNEEIRTLFQP